MIPQVFIYRKRP